MLNRQSHTKADIDEHRCIAKRRTPPFVLLALLAVMAAGSLAACGSDDDTATATQAAATGFPTTITNRQGAVEITAEPKRVVTLDFPSTDAVLALGIVPIAMGKVSYVPGGVQTWTQAALKGRTPPMINTETSIPLERIAELDPDLVVGTNAYSLPAVYKKLSRIAPVVTWKTGPGLDSWQQSTVLVGQALGREQQARKLVADTEARVARAAADHPAFKNKTVTLFNLYKGDAYAISSPADFSIRFLTTLGFRLTPTIARLNDTQQAGETESRVQVSAERRRLLDADVVLGTSADSPQAMKALVREPLFRRLSAVKRDAYATLDIGRATSIAFPTALSVSYALDELVPLLDRLTR